MCFETLTLVRAHMILGVDPGLTGALAVYDSTQRTVVEAANIPTLTITRNHKNKQVVDIHALVRLVRDLIVRYPTIRGLVELVGAMPKQGVTSSFAFGRTDGVIETAIVAAGIPYQKIPPQTWKKNLGCTADKDQTLLKASQLMPQSAERWTPVRGVRDKEMCKGLAEAALIAYYGAKHLA